MTRTRLSRQELYELVWAAPVRQIAPRYGVSDIGFAKACRAANIPLPPRGYWAKRQAGHDVPRPPLPRPSTPGQDHVVIGSSSAVQSRRDFGPADLSSLPAVPVPQQLRQPHAVVAATRDRLKALRPGADGRLFLRDDHGCFGLRVGPQSVRRALRILQAICAEAERRGWSVVSAGADGYRRTASAGIRIGRHLSGQHRRAHDQQSPPAGAAASSRPAARPPGLAAATPRSASAPAVAAWMSNGRAGAEHGDGRGMTPPATMATGGRGARSRREQPCRLSTFPRWRGPGRASRQARADHRR